MPVGHAILVGVDAYDHYSPLRFCSADVAMMTRCLRETRAFGVPPDKISQLSTDTRTPPTRESILGLVRQVLSTRQDDEGIFFYFAGQQSAPWEAVFGHSRHTSLRLRRLGHRSRGLACQPAGRHCSDSCVCSRQLPLRNTSRRGPPAGHWCRRVREDSHSAVPARRGIGGVLLGDIG